MVLSELASTVLDRPLFRAGETVHMKHFFRKHSLRGMEKPDRLPKVAQITHSGSLGQSYELPLSWESGRCGRVDLGDSAGSETRNLFHYLAGKSPKKKDSQESEGDDGEGRETYGSYEHWRLLAFTKKFRVEEYRAPDEGDAQLPAQEQISPSSTV